MWNVPPRCPLLYTTPNAEATLKHHHWLLVESVGKPSVRVTNKKALKWYSSEADITLRCVIHKQVEKTLSAISLINWFFSYQQIYGLTYISNIYKALWVTILDKKINKKFLTYESIVNVSTRVFKLCQPRRLFGSGHALKTPYRYGSATEL